MAEKLRFYHITDLHFSSGNSKHDADMRRVIDGAFKQLTDDSEVDTVLISGDLTNSGDRDSHEAVISKLRELQKAGKKVYITFATHDWYFHDDSCTREELREMYNDFGFFEAYSEFPGTYSYAVKLCDGWRLLALNDDGDGREFCGYGDEELHWIKQQLELARQAGDQVVAMTHHPILPPNVIYPIISHRDMLGGYETTGPMLAKWGLKYLFVGHTHMQDIRYIESRKGNRMYQVNTGSLTQYPGPMRRVVETDEGLDVKTVLIDKKYCAIDGKCACDYLKDEFYYMLQDTFYSVAYDIPNFASIAVGLSMDYNTVMKYRKLIAPVGKFLYKLTFKKAGRLFACSKSIDKSIENKRVKDFFICAARNIFRGSEDFSPDTPEYKAVTAIVARLAPMIKLYSDDGGRIDPVKLVSEIIYDDGPDDQNEVLYSALRPVEKEENTI